MEYEFVILDKNWLIENSRLGKLDQLYYIINKAYDKARIKYNIITTQRIKRPDLVLNDLGFDVDKNFFFVLSLASENAFHKASKKVKPFKRNFFEMSDSLDNTYNCDLPSDFVKEIESLESPSVTIRVAGSTFQLNEDVSRRLLGTAGFKEQKYEEKGHIHLELTGFTSFMRRHGPFMLDSVIDLAIRNRIILRTLTNKENIQEVTLLVEAIKEHNLIEYYIDHCGFVNSGKEDFLCKVSSNGGSFKSTLEEGIKARCDFHISFVHRYILLD